MTRAAAAALLCLAALAVAACGQERKPALAWTARPLLVKPPALPNDRILSGQVRNASSRELSLAARDVRLLDARGHRVPGVAIFLGQYKHRIQAFNRPDPVPGLEQRLAGYRAQLRPGQRLALTVSWHRPRGAPRQPVRVSLAGASLPIPPG